MNGPEGTLPAFAPHVLTASRESRKPTGAFRKASGVNHLREDCDISEVLHGDSFEWINDVIPKAWIINGANGLLCGQRQ